MLLESLTRAKRHHVRVMERATCGSSQDSTALHAALIHFAYCRLRVFALDSLPEWQWTNPCADTRGPLTRRRPGTAGPSFFVCALMRPVYTLRRNPPAPGPLAEQLTHAGALTHAIEMRQALGEGADVHAKLPPAPKAPEKICIHHREVLEKPAASRQHFIGNPVVLQQQLARQRRTLSSLPGRSQ